jgi:hypothetical protein
VDAITESLLNTVRELQGREMYTDSDDILWWVRDDRKCVPLDENGTPLLELTWYGLPTQTEQRSRHSWLKRRRTLRERDLPMFEQLQAVETLKPISELQLVHRKMALVQARLDDAEI